MVEALECAVERDETSKRAEKPEVNEMDGAWRNPDGAKGEPLMLGKPVEAR